MVTTSDETGWLLVIDPPNGSSAAFPLAQKILGLALPLRLALTAQAAGARAVAVADGPAHAEVKRLLVDSRLRLRVIDEGDRPSLLEFRSRSPSIRTPANLVVHRATFVALIQHASGEMTLPPSSEAASKAIRGAGGIFAFEPIVVSDRASARIARAALLRSLRKPQDGWTSTYLNRHVSLTISRILVAT